MGIPTDRGRCRASLIFGLALAALASACAGNPMSTPPGDQPVITCPAGPTVVSPDGVTAIVSYGDPVVAGGKAPFLTNCTPVSGAFFPVGTSTVTCRTVDSLQRTSSCSFSVHVTRPPQISLTKFVAFGDSITFGEDGRNSASDPRSVVSRPYVVVGTPYPKGLLGLLQQRYTSQAFTVDNKGVQGVRAADDVSRFHSQVVLTGQYQVALLMEGANDLGSTDNISTDISGAIGGLRQMVQDAKARGIRVFLATIPPEKQYLTNPIIDRAHKPASDILALNDQIRVLAFTESVTLVDVYQAFPNPDLNDLHALGLLSSDGLHPQQAGYDLIASKFFDAIKIALELPATPAVTTAWPAQPSVKIPPVRKK